MCLPPSSLPKWEREKEKGRWFFQDPLLWACGLEGGEAPCCHSKIRGGFYCTSFVCGGEIEQSFPRRKKAIRPSPLPPPPGGGFFTHFGKREVVSISLGIVFVFTVDVLVNIRGRES